MVDGVDAQQQGRAVSDAGVLPLLGQKRRPVGKDLRLVVTSLYAQGFPPVQLRRARAVISGNAVVHRHHMLQPVGDLHHLARLAVK